MKSKANQKQTSVIRFHIRTIVVSLKNNENVMDCKERQTKRLWKWLDAKSSEKGNNNFLGIETKRTE